MRLMFIGCNLHFYIVNIDIDTGVIKNKFRGEEPEHFVKYFFLEINFLDFFLIWSPNRREDLYF